MLSDSVHLVGDAPELLTKLKDHTDTVHKDVTFECDIAPGQPKAKVYWYRDSHELYDGHKYHISYVDSKATLIVFDIDATDAGTYMCEASNKLGRVETSAKLTVLGM